MQENRSFDSCFGTYLGANGIPAGVCNPIKAGAAACVAPFHDVHDTNSGGPHGFENVAPDIDNAAMDGFVQQEANVAGVCGAGDNPPAVAQKGPFTGCAVFYPGLARHDVMGYHTNAEIPNYWAYAQNFVLQDEMFESGPLYSLPSHLFLTSEWTARCTKGMLSTCQTSVHPAPVSTTSNAYPWVSLFQLMDQHGVSWKYYLDNGPEPDCDDGALTCAPTMMKSQVLSLWNPVPGFGWVQKQGAAYLALHNPAIDQFLVDVKNGTLPQVSYIVPQQNNSEHPTARVTTGMEFVTSLVNAVAQSPYWQNTAIFITWDDWGGFYDHVAPPRPGNNASDFGYGFRVPGLMVSAWAKPGLVDHQILSFDTYATFIENLFMNGARLDPVAMGQPDARPEVRDEQTSVVFPNGTTAPIGDLMNEFDFTRQPAPPLVLSTRIPTQITINCGSTDSQNPQICGSSKVVVTWTAVPDVQQPLTYTITRDGSAVVCSTMGTSCADTSAPPGVHFYTASSVNTLGAVSPQSAAAEADVP